MRLNRFEDHKVEDIEWALNLLNQRVEVITSNVLRVRGDKSKLMLDACGFCFGREAVELNLVDSVVNSPEVYVKSRFGDDVRLMMVKPDW